MGVRDVSKACLCVIFGCWQVRVPIPWLHHPNSADVQQRAVQHWWREQLREVPCRRVRQRLCPHVLQLHRCLCCRILWGRDRADIIIMQWPMPAWIVWVLLRIDVVFLLGQLFRGVRGPKS